MKPILAADISANADAESHYRMLAHLGPNCNLGQQIGAVSWYAKQGASADVLLAEAVGDGGVSANRIVQGEWYELRAVIPSHQTTLRNVGYKYTRQEPPLGSFSPGFSGTAAMKHPTTAEVIAADMDETGLWCAGQWSFCLVLSFGVLLEIF